jgi:hypothetical protein
MMLFAGNFILVPAVAVLFVFTARRQRLPLAWPILSTALILILSPHWDNRPMLELPFGFSSAHFLYQLSDEAIRTSIVPPFLGAWWSVAAVQWQAFAAQYLLVVLPLASLVHRHCQTRAIP